MAELSKFEEEHYKMAVESAAQRVSKLSVDKADEAMQLIEQLHNEEFKHQGLKTKFTNEVLKRATEMRKKAKSEKEKTLIEQFEGKIQKDSGAKHIKDKYQHVGVEKNFKFTLGWLPARAWQRISGGRIDAEKLNTWIDEIEEYKEEIRKNRIKLEMYKAAKKSMGDLKVLAKAAGKAITSMDSGVLKGVVSSYLEARKKATTAEAAIVEKEKEMAEKQKKLDAALKKVDELRKNGKELFDKAFGPRVDTLLAHKEEMDPSEFEDEVLAIRVEVQRFGKDMGITYMEFFLNEKLGLRPVTDAGTEYKEPHTEKEKARERAVLSRWWGEWAPSKVSESELMAFIDTMRQEQPRLLTLLVEGKHDPEITEILTFLYKGNLKGKRVLPQSRLVKPSAAGVVDVLGSVTDYIGTGNLEQIMRTFANSDWKDYKADDFATVFHMIQSGHSLPKVSKPSLPSLPEDEVRNDLRTIFALPVAASGTLTMTKEIDKVLYENVLKRQPELQAMLKETHVQDKMSFFTTGLFGSLDFSRFPLFDKEKKPDDLLALVKQIRLIEPIDKYAFEDAAKEYFDHEKNPTMHGFLSHLKREFGTPGYAAAA